MNEVLKNLYEKFKENTDIHLIFVTGISKLLKF